MTSGLILHRTTEQPLDRMGILSCFCRVLIGCLVFAGMLVSSDSAHAQYGGAPGAGGAPPGGPTQSVVPKRRFTQLEADTGEIVYDVRFEGVQTILPQAIQSKVQTQAGRPLSERQIREDVRNLYSTRWFYSVEPRVEDTERGPLVVFRLLERPIVKGVEFIGNKKYTSAYLGKYIGLTAGSSV